jgi:hypothetical protein
MQVPQDERDTNMSWNSIRLSDASYGPSSGGSKIEANEGLREDEQAPAATDADRVVIESNKDRAVKYVSGST